MTEITEDLLLSWWHNCGEEIYTLSELEQFKQIIRQYGVERVFEIVIASVIVDDGSPTMLLTAMRCNRADELFESLPDVSTFSEDNKKVFENVKNTLLEALTS